MQPALVAIYAPTCKANYDELMARQRYLAKVRRLASEEQDKLDREHVRNYCIGSNLPANWKG